VDAVVKWLLEQGFVGISILGLGFVVLKLFENLQKSHEARLADIRQVMDSVNSSSNTYQAMAQATENRTRATDAVAAAQKATAEALERQAVAQRLLAEAVEKHSDAIREMTDKSEDMDRRLSDGIRQAEIIKNGLERLTIRFDERSRRSREDDV
jgi:methyl-accepting chemotaxis protein